MEILPIIVQTKFVVLQVDFNVTYEKNDEGEIDRGCTSVRFAIACFRYDPVLRTYPASF